MARNKKKREDQEQEELNEVTDQRSLEERIEDFVLKYKVHLGVSAGAIAVIVVGYLFYTQMILAPMEQEAAEEIYRAQWAYEDGNFEKALHGEPGEFAGFLEISENYGRTKSGNLANYYAGSALLHQGEYNRAIEHFRQFRTESKMLLPMKLGGKGDAYSQLGQYEKAAEFYMKAAQSQDNKLTAPIYFRKAGLVYEELGEYGKALDAFQQVVDNYSGHRDVFEIRKYIGRVEARMQQ
jgi:tetratricopeptide (TPR) repeat protein